MKNFFKKLSFVLAIAMVLTSVVPATTASAASKVQIELNGKAVTEVTAFFGGVVRNLDASKNGKAASGTWKVGNTKVATVDSKTGVITPVGEGTTKVAFTLKGEKKASASVLVKVRTRAAALHVYDPSEYATGTRNKLEDTTIELNVGEDKELKVTMPISKKASNAGAKIATYFLYADSSNEDVVKVSASTKMYTRAVTLKPVAAGEATVTLFANQTTKANARANKYVKEAKFTVKVAGNSSIKSAKASKVNEVTVEFTAPVADDTILTVTKGTSDVTGVAKWSEDKTSVVFTTDANMTNGTYTVNVKVGEKTYTADFDVESQRVEEIIIKDDVALTGKVGNEAAKKAFVYYVVLDQYGTDITDTTSIRWSSSTGADHVTCVEKGRLEVTRSDTRAFTFGEQLFISGVYEKTGKNVSKTLTIGMEQQPDKIEMVGFVKKDTTEILTKLPKRFTADTYLLLFNVVDQNGNKMNADAAYSKTDVVTFITSPMLLVEGVEFKNNNGVMNIGEKSYNTAWVKPGMNVGEGGEFSIQAISAKTGKMETATFSVEDNQVLKSFEIGTIKKGTLANGDTGVEYNFKALDTEGNDITKFTVLHNNKNLLKVTGSNVTVKIAQRANDSIAVLVDTNIGGPNFTTGSDLDGIDTPANISTVVIGGEAKTTMLGIADARRPVGIKETAIADYYVEGDTIHVSYRTDSPYDKGIYMPAVAAGAKIVYVDQYGVAMSEFNASRFFGKQLNGTTEFSGYKYYLGFELDGKNINVLDTVDEGGVGYIASKVAVGSKLYLFKAGSAQVDIKIATDGAITTNNADNTIKFAIYREKTDSERVSTEKVKTFGVIDVNLVENISAVEAQKVLTNSPAAPYSTLPEYQTVTSKLLNDVAVSAGAITWANGEGRIAVTGTYKKATVAIPDMYVRALGAYVSGEEGGLDTIEKDLYFSKLYDVRSTNYAKTELKDTLNVWLVDEFNLGTGANDVDRTSHSVVSCNTTVGIIDSGLGIASVKGLENSVAYTADSKASGKALLSTTDWTAMTSKLFSSMALTDGTEGFVFKDANGDLQVVKKYTVLADGSNAPGVVMPGYVFLFNASNVVEAEGVASGSVKIAKQNSADLEITGLESGDTFNITTTIMYDGHVVSTWTTKVTVQYDGNAVIDDQYERNNNVITGTSAGWFNTIITNAN